jgi:dihydropyrimidine dehydrogenase (NAD+) subunit PreA
VTEGPLFYGTVVDIDTMTPLAPGPAVITYGAHRRPIINLQCARTRALGDDFEVMSSSGVWSASDAIERMMCGARLVGLHTAIQYHGHELFTKIIRGVDVWLDEKGLELDEIVGKAVPQITSQEAHDEFMRERDRSAEQIEPEIDSDSCNGCGICANCIHGGISMEDGEPQTHLDLCVRCGVCESICPTDAITMQVQ